ncbi:acyl-CoA dehydrogenase family protein [Streptomyces sp. WI04-05B]|uniref:acyl-CoA dehydrogenase family protein n=1 Tax=Streptomyces TaxID=1883 RepID=UPI0029A4A582|nr:MULTISPECIES: acyl-CoA dehydrogenase family protein [unclassified Streptomyces]MDX2545682.1 acyl-CoA dehydrogenase family protein [Streptomyces sp. WI04-05B]MDX2583413.1 acyl-CoA dehydrogenase family protein [Streptomyces sp. WI04-05A]
MRFAVTERDAALAEAAGEVLAKQAGTEQIRAGWPGGRAESVDVVWRTLAGVGVIGALIPETAESSGDLGLGLDENALPPLMEALGRAGLPVPAAETVAVGAPLLAAAGAPQLPSVIDGSSLLTVSFTPDAPVPFAARAELIAVADKDRLRLYTRAEVETEPVGSVDGSRQSARVRVPAGGGLVLAEGPAELAIAHRRGVLASAALLVGLSGRMLELTVAHVRERQQFGVPVGSFQAVKHALADVELAVRFARPAVLAAGWAQAARDPEAAVRTSMAKVLASEAARKAARTAIQCHGAIGYTTEYDLHLYAKRAWALAADWGGPAEHREFIARRLGLAGMAGIVGEGAAT